MSCSWWRQLPQKNRIFAAITFLLQLIGDIGPRPVPLYLGQQSGSHELRLEGTRRSAHVQMQPVVNIETLGDGVEHLG